MIKRAVEGKGEKLGFLKFQAKQKMPYALGRTNSNIKKVVDGGSCSLSKTSLKQNNSKDFSKDSEVPAFIWRNSDQRYVHIARIALEPDARWTIVLQNPDQRNPSSSGPGVQMESLDLVPSRPAMTQRSQPPERTYSAKSFTVSRCAGSNVLQQSQYRGMVNKRTKTAKVSCSSSQKNSFISDNSSALIEDGSIVNGSSDLLKNIPKVNKPIKKNSRKKARKKGKQYKKPTCSSNFTDFEAFCEEGVCSSSTSERCANNDPVSGNGPVLVNSLSDDSISSLVSLWEGTVNINSSKDNSIALNNHSITQTVCMPYSGEVDESEAKVPFVPHSCTGDHLVVNSTDGIETTDTLLSTFNGEAVDPRLKETSYCDGISSEFFSNAHSIPLLDSISDCWNSDYSTNNGDDVEEQSSFKADTGITPSEPPGHNNYGCLLHSAGKGCLSCGNSSDAVNADNYAERTKSGSQGCSSSDIHSVISGKRGRQKNNNAGHRFSSSGRLHGHTGKENNHSVWQKVRRNDADEGICEPKNVNSVGLQCDISSKEVPLLKRGSNAAASDVLLKPKDNKGIKIKVSENSKRKLSTGSKQEYKYHPRKGLDASKTNSNRHAKMNVPQKEEADIPLLVNHHKGFNSVSKSPRYIECCRPSLQTYGVDCIFSEAVHSLQVSLEEMKPCRSACATVNIVSDQDAPNQNSSSLWKKDSLDQSNLLEVQSPLEFELPIGTRTAKLETEISHMECNTQDHNSGSILQKWVPVVRKDAGLTSILRPDNLSVPYLDDGWTMQNVVEELSSNCNTLHPSRDGETVCVGGDSGNINNSLPEDEDGILKSIDHATCIFKEKSRMHAASNCYLSHESKDHKISVFETDSSKISQAVNDALRLQLASEAVQLATGCPLAEFERLLHSASPVLGQTHGAWHCQTCLRDQHIDVSLCRHEIPNISLGSLWQWYEKHGSYGLEVRAEDYQNSKRLGIDCFEFRAYFVPFLSAVQLFGNCRNYPMDNSNEIPSSEVLKACDTDEALESSSQIDWLPIFSVLIPKPHRKGVKSSSGPWNPFCMSESLSTPAKDKLKNHSLSAASYDDSELLFEYFESEQPQQRQPLFEKIKELVRGGPLNCQAYGDPTKLDSLDLHDLHPSSWYSVAWYPIYRIPEGNFRAAFLTYHSLGHLIHRSASSDSLGGDTCIVSPVVGLQSYNAQSECWFKSRHSMVTQSEETSSFNPSEILKLRLRALEQTASVMSRAVVKRGNLRSVNRQHDYEFFLSRQRW